MRENFGHGWVDRGPRRVVPGWDNGKSDKPSSKTAGKVAVSQYEGAAR
ncbi:hypothetical protein AU152_gp43 [Mycobacterium phage Phlei]|uniref:Uncharacterized protein n=1 Tax=Mycobacterium phage Phlei TaxID=1690684 RepID=A0A0N9BDS1_9CAUD|nr:hypothetical protein AU152_gp43 [Mycobacterium phage Phlei]ALA48156.1 hypothetical protein [Mycobacterium phage Phlei]